MAKPINKREAKVSLYGINELPGRLRAVIKPAQDEFAASIREKIINEAPKRSGKLRESIQVEITREYKNTYSTQIIIGGDEAPYAFDVWQGIDTLYGANEKQAMAFPIWKWPGYQVGFWEANRNGYFISAGPIRHVVQPNDFIGRALTNLDEAKFIWRKYFKVFEGKRTVR